MNAIGIIPARMGSSRFPGKPMARICDSPMIGHCYLRTRMCTDLLDTYVATCDTEIHDYITSIGGKAIMTADTHERACDRTAEAMLLIEEKDGKPVDVVVMVQGDEPLVTPGMVSASLSPFSDPSVNVVNLMAIIRSEKEFEDPNEIKVVVDKQGYAIYFSREPIPTRSRGITDALKLKQVCIIPFRRDYLIKFNSTPETLLEQVESVDMMRIIENGEKVKMIMSDEETYAVDTEIELKAVESMMKSDPLFLQYR